MASIATTVEFMQDFVKLLRRERDDERRGDATRA
jgi:hypothetical protein